MWYLATKRVDVEEGYYSEDIFYDSHNVQESTLVISAAKLVELKVSAAKGILTCETIVGSIKKALTAVQTITIFNPGESDPTILFRADLDHWCYIYFIFCKKINNIPTLYC